MSVGAVLGIDVAVIFVGVGVLVAVGFLLGVGVFLFFAETPFTSVFALFSTIGFFIFVLFCEFGRIKINKPKSITTNMKLPKAIINFILPGAAASFLK